MPLSTSAPYALRTDKLKSLAACLAGTSDATAPPQPLVLAICGSFNPAHSAHVKLYDTVKRVIDGKEGRTVLGGFLSPVADAYGKPGLRSAADRVGVLDAILECHPDLNVDTWECTQPTYTRTLYVLRALEEHVNAHYAVTEPDAMELLASRGGGGRVRVVLVCGADLFASFWIPGCWPLPLLRQLLDSFPVVVVYRADARGGVRGADDFAEVCRTAPVLTETAADGTTTEIDMRQYHFTFTSFPVPDDTSSTAVREAAMALAKTPEAEVAARAALEARLRAMLPEAAIPFVVRLYGHTAEESAAEPH